MKKIKFAVIGSGWRAEFYIRIARLVPDRFELTGLLTRDPDKAAQIAEQFQIRTVTNLEDLLKGKPEFVVLSIKRGFVPGFLEQLFALDIPVLCETPPAETFEELESLWYASLKNKPRIQIAEQYFLQPFYAAWLQVIRDGMIGPVSNINISALHGYHAISMIRKFLGVDVQSFSVTGQKHLFQVTNTLSREGPDYSGSLIEVQRDRATLKYSNGQIAFFDFSGVQYHSFIRTRQLNIQGLRGEIDDLTIRYLNTDNIPVKSDLNRVDLGIYNNQEWSHQAILLGDRELYRNPFPNARLNDDEIAVATCMLKMREYLDTGNEFYPLRDALEDTYTALLLEKAVNNPGQSIQSERQVWH